MGMAGWAAGLGGLAGGAWLQQYYSSFVVMAQQSHSHGAGFTNHVAAHVRCALLAGPVADSSGLGLGSNGAGPAPAACCAASLGVL